jgi:EAL domain-containing protein (putative c-di-GMP-specific phosphodiesterase class I)
LARVDEVVDSLLAALSKPFVLGVEQAFVSASIGITLFPDDATAIDDLLKHADQALYLSKGNGRNRASYFTPALQHAATLRARLSGDLRVALAQGQLWVAYQPVVDLRTGAVTKAEALLRWDHPKLGRVDPEQFIPLAESSGQIVEIGNWVFEQAIKQVAVWRHAYHPEFQISVNKSPIQFHHPEASPAVWLSQLGVLGLPGQSIVVEITEGLLLDASPEVTSQMLTFRDAGIGVALDDFGTGYSSLHYLQNHDVDFIKIDQSFVRHLSSSAKDVTLCQAMIVMAHALGMKVVAEGVETAMQRDLLLSAGCDYGQGYFFAKPMSAPEFAAFLAQSPAP